MPGARALWNNPGYEMGAFKLALSAMAMFDGHNENLLRSKKWRESRLTIGRRTKVKVAMYALFGIAGILAIIGSSQYLQPRPHILTRAEAINATIAFDDKYFNETMPSNATIKATLYHTFQTFSGDYRTFVVDDKTMKDSNTAVNNTLIESTYWWGMDVRGRSFLVDAETGKILGGQSMWGYRQ